MRRRSDSRKERLRRSRPTGAERPRSRATGGQRELKNTDFGSPRTVYSPLTSLVKNLQPAYLCLLLEISPLFIGTYKRTSG